MRLQIVCLSALFLFAWTDRAHAFLDLRATYSMLQSNPGGVNDHIGSDVPKLAGMQAFGADVLTRLPAFPLLLGARYERFTSGKSSATGSGDARYTRTSVLVSKRLIDTGAYLGFVATGGIANDFSYETKVAGTRAKFKADSGFSASAGLEAGLKLTVLRVGVEAGYLHAPLGNLKSSSGAELLGVSGDKVKVDLSGAYARAVVGFGF